jgi:mannan endo-1,6-alpha-mannosidase
LKLTHQTNGSAIWQERVEGLLNTTIKTFFPNGIAYEVICEAKVSTCSIDMLSFKAYLTRWMAASAQVAPFIYDRVIAVLQTSATAAALQCSGSPADHPNGRMCGLSWAKGADWDGSSGVGQQMAALEVIQSNLIQQATAPLTSTTGGTSQGNPNAGQGGQDPNIIQPAGQGDKVGTGILTAAVGCVVIAGLAWISLPDKHM